MDNNPIVISYDPQDFDAAKKLSNDLTNKGLQAELVNYDAIENPTDLVKYSHFLALLSKHPEKLAEFFKRLFTELENYLYTNQNFLIPIATDDSYNENENPDNLPAIFTPLSLTDYDNCLSRIINKVRPAQYKDPANKELKFQWEVTYELFKLSEEARIKICQESLGKDYGRNLPTTILCKKLLEKLHNENALDDLWTIIQKCHTQLYA